MRLAAIWSEVLGASSVGIDQDFFSLGGTSLLVIEVRARIAKEFGVTLPLRPLFETPTIEAIAGQLARPGSSADPIIVHLRRGRTGLPPLFCLFGVQLYQDLAAALGDNRPVIGMHVPFRNAPGKPLPSVREIASRYVELIRRYQPAGPYHLAGLCFGGITAFEAGRQLEALGERVTLVAVFDGYLPRGVHVAQLKRLGQYAQKAVREPRAIVTWLKAKADRLVRMLRVAGPLAATNGSADDWTELPVDGPEITGVVRKYQRTLGQLDTHLMVFRSSKRVWPEWITPSLYLGWDQLAARVSLHEVASDHMGLVREPHVRVVARAISEALEEGRRE
jgi:thioesterase domain-containing protein